MRKKISLVKKTIKNKLYIPTDDFTFSTLKTVLDDSNYRKSLIENGKNVADNLLLEIMQLIHIKAWALNAGCPAWQRIQYKKYHQLP